MARMTKRRKQSRRSARLDFAAIEVVGGLLPTDVIAQIAAGDAAEQSDESYGIPKGLKLRDEIARFYQIAHAHWESFEAAKGANASAPIGFVQSLLSECFGFKTLTKSAGKQIADRTFPVNFSAENGRIPVIIAPSAPADSRKPGIDEALSQFGDDTRRRSATQLLQEYLNADEDALWGITCDGSVLRIMRDNASLTRPAWIEVNFEKVFTEGLFPDFSAVWLILHASRFGADGTSPSDCPLERWKERSRLDGAAAKDYLRLGVEAALIELGRGFIQHPYNTDLRDKFQSGELRRQAYYEELLRLVYRIIFLFAAEDRDLLHAPNTSDAARKAYLGGYSLHRLRERCVRNASLDKNIDAWEGMKSLFKALSDGQPALGLVALGGLFDPEKLAHLGNCKIENKRFLKAIWHVAWFRPEGQAMTKVNWRDMETEELGSVYESLLELTPELNLEAREFTFAEGDATKGNARKVSGSYYTPDSLVKLLLDTTLDPVLDAAEARNPSDPVSEILKLSMIDPACGSGHFLLGAARRAAGRIARHRMPGAISQEVFQHALREVVGNCIYGSDRNPMAVELCKVALWIEALEPGKPLSFLDARIKCGDSLIGIFDYEMLKAGIPDDAYTAMSGDDKAVAKAYERLNKDERDGKAASGFIKTLAAPAEIVDGARKIAAMPEDTLSEVKAKARAFARYEASDQWQRLKLACDMYVAAFFTPKVGETPSARTLVDMPVPTTGAMWEAVAGNIRSDVLLDNATKVSEENSALHWPLAFPAVMARGGFDAVVGNPPWERIKLQEQEFFASRDTAIATAKNKAARDKLIKALSTAEEGTREHNLFLEFEAAKRAAEASSFFVRKTGRFPLSGVGDVNTYALFAEHFSRLARRPQQNTKSAQTSLLQAIADTGGVREAPAGRAGMIVPTGIATDSSTSAFFGDLVSTKRLNALYDFENRDGIFPGVHRSFKFSTLSIGLAKVANFAFFLHDVSMLEEKERRFTLSPEQIAAINPNTKTAPVFRSRADAELTAKLYSKAPVLIEERPDHPEGDKNPWGISFQTMFHMSNDSGYFRGTDDLEKIGFARTGTDWEHSDGRRYVPLYEAKMIHHYDHRWATYEGEDEEQGTRDVTLEEKQDPNFEPTPRYWVPEDEVDMRASRVPTRLKTAFKKDDAEGCLKILAEWVLGSTPGLSPQNPVASLRDIQAHLAAVLGPQATSSTVVGRSLQNWLSAAAPRGVEMQRYTPLDQEDLAFIKEYGGRWLELTGDLIDRKKARWFLSWRDITNSTNERTVIAAVYPYSGVSNKLPVMNLPSANGIDAACIVSNLSSLTFDYVSRQKIGGTSMNYFIYKQLPLLAPDQFNSQDKEFIQPRIIELTYTSHAMRPWAEDLGYTGTPFAFDPDRRAQLRAELDAFFAKKYGLTRDELRYVLDPHDVKGSDYPSETFRGLKNKEINQFGEYRTQRLVLEAFDRMTGG
ncbi:type II DNA modification enzyme [Thalassobius vesicularis]|uniref:site-specific DNA-methyltransferase (adenine-specific) n=1 Tax=Thalassobius vesicularis TaxID=1294297 RepID=A0A4S3M5U8_9RHOB|nr:N-6 DNA methylase [Thalassobius vesicularis]THD71265.1 type II DNA modification enzyme [Thalassobius vesicularis]